MPSSSRKPKFQGIIHPPLQQLYLFQSVSSNEYHFSMLGNKTNNIRRK
jgi:hypothetical protein